jgi:predicted transcriptional regulator
MTFTIVLKEGKEKSLSEIATKQGKSIEILIEELLDNYIVEREEARQLMKLSESVFQEWDNDADAFYDGL